MTVSNDSTDKTAGLINRIRGILLKPDAEWVIIDTEPATIGSLYRNYILILAAIGPVAGLVRSEVFGYGAYGVTFRPSIVSALASAVVGYVLTLVFVYILALITDALAPTFQGQKNQLQAMKLATYASTAGWLAGIFQLIPGLGILALLGLYNLYLFYHGVPVMMKSPADKSMVYTVVVIVVAIVLAVIISPITALLAGSI
jgi:hypothetical protein